jgi:outer membrane protein W
VFPAPGDNISFEAGVYDFTDIEAKEFYKIAPSLYVNYEAHRKSKLSVCIVSGISHSSVNYNRKKHYLFIIPLFVSICYNFIDSSSKFQPFIGGGFSVQGKFDKNHKISRPHSSITYGNHMLAGLKYTINKKVIFFGTLRYNVLIPSYFEDLNTNGIITTIGLKYPIQKREKITSPVRNAFRK